MAKKEKIDKALQGLESLNEASREKAVNLLARTKDPRVLPALERAARSDQSLKIRFLAKEGLQQIRMNLTQGTNLDDGIGQEAKTGPRPLNLDRLKKHLSDPDAGKRNKAVKAAMAYMNPTALKVLVPHVRRERNLKVKGNCVLSLGILGSKEQIPLLMHYLEHKESHLRACAVLGLSNISEVSVYPRLVHSMGDRSQTVRKAAFKALLRLGKPKLIKLLHKMVLSKHKWMRFSAARACGKFMSLRILKVLAMALRDDSSNVRKVARASLRRLKRQGMQEAEDLLEDYRRAGGDVTMTEISIPSNLHALASPINDDDPRARLAEIQRMMSEKDTTLLDMAKARLSVEEDSRVMASLIMALGKLGGAPLLDLLKPYLSSADRRIKASAVEALSFMNSDDVIPLLVPMLEDSDNRVRGNAIVALKNASQVDVITPLRELVTSDDRNCKLSAIYAILELQRADATGLLKLIENDPDELICQRVNRARQILADTSLMGNEKVVNTVESGRLEIPQELEAQAPSQDDILPSTASGTPLGKLVSEASGKTLAPGIVDDVSGATASVATEDGDDKANKKNLPGFRTQIDNMFAQAAKEPKKKKKRDTKEVKAPGKPVEEGITRENFIEKIKSFFSRGEEEKKPEEPDGTPKASNIIVICGVAVVLFLVFYLIFGMGDEGYNDDEVYDDDDF